MDTNTSEKAFVGRFAGEGEMGKFLSPVILEGVPLNTLEVCLSSLEKEISHLELYRFGCQSWSEDLLEQHHKEKHTPDCWCHSMTVDEAASINLYTKEWQPRVKNSFIFPTFDLSHRKTVCTSSLMLLSEKQTEQQ